MKKLTVILFENDLEFKEYSDQVCEKFADLPAEKEFCGIWGEILFNSEECISSISGCVNHFINTADKTEIIFGIGNKDYDSVISKINTENCVIETVKCDNL
jgi:hypothetical protein